MMGDKMTLEEAYRRMGPSAYGVALLILCIFVGTAEGYDVQAMALGAPLLAKAWHLPPSGIGMLLAASVVGQVIGSFLLAPLGDRWGRRPAILLGLLGAAVATGAGVVAPEYASLVAGRVCAGLALGLALSNTTALAMEIVPVRWRTIAVVLVCCGYPAGAAAGAAIVGHLLPTLGYVAIFYVGGTATLIAFVLCAVLLPESPARLARREGARPALHRLLARLGVPIAEDVAIVSDHAAPTRSRVAELLTPERRSVTLLLWLLNFANLSLVYYFVMWLPSLFVSRGLAAQSAVAASSLFSASGIVGGLVLASLIARRGAVATLAGCYLVTIVAVLVFSSLTAIGPAFFVTLAVCGAMVIGSQFCLSAVVALFYPDEIRATGSGYAVGAGRLGAVFAPLLGGIIVARMPSVSAAFAVAAIPAVISLIAILALRQSKLSQLGEIAR
jgi:AAHS family 4-hydroxybenzoate transporter-like MFS transporter